MHMMSYCILGLLDALASVGDLNLPNLPDSTKKGVEAQAMCVWLKEEGPFLGVFLLEHPRNEPRVLSSQQKVLRNFRRCHQLRNRLSSNTCSIPFQGYISHPRSKRYKIEWNWYGMWNRCGRRLETIETILIHTFGRTHSIYSEILNCFCMIFDHC